MSELTIDKNNTESQAHRKPETRNEIICADSHVTTPPDFWGDYLPERFRAIAPKIEEGDDFDYVVFQGKKSPLNLLASQAGREGKNFKIQGKVSDIGRGGWEPATRLEDMNLDSIDAAVLFGGGPLGTDNTDFYIESFRAYNRWLSNFCSHDRGRLVGVGYIPLRDVDESIAFMKECKKLGFNTVNIPAFPMDKENPAASGPRLALGAQALALTGNPNGERQYDQPEFDPFWAAAVDLDMTITIHLGARIARFGNKDYFLSDLVNSKLAMAEPISIMIFGGVFDRHPELRFVSVESGTSWFAFAATYMDRTWEKQRFWTNCQIKQTPSFYWDQNIYGTFIHDRPGVLMRDLPGAGNIMWSSDYPHSETTFPHSLECIARDCEGVPEDARREILCERAKRVFKVGQ